jgi:hypothetical protein
MKLLQITALALCLNIPMTHTMNDNSNNRTSIAIFLAGNAVAGALLANGIQDLERRRQNEYMPYVKITASVLLVAGSYAIINNPWANNCTWNDSSN